MTSSPKSRSALVLNPRRTSTRTGSACIIRRLALHVPPVTPWMIRAATSNTSFCSNSACHGNVYTFAGFDAPKLREILQSQLPPPEPTPAEPTLTGAPTYDNYVGPLVTAKCSACHGDLATAGLNMLTYEGMMKGGSDGPVIVPGDPANSKLFQIQSAGGHFANLTAEELEIIKQWIKAGAPEK